MKIGLVGTYDVENFGDCMFPEMYAHLLGNEFPEAQISLYSPTSNPAEILSFDQVNKLPATADTAHMAEDIVILTGGETITYGHSTGAYVFPSSTLSAALRLWYGPLVAAQNTQMQFIVHCVGATKIPANLASTVGRLLSHADYVSFRDQVSLDRFKSVASSLECSVDPMFLISDLLSQSDWQQRAIKKLPDGLKPGEYFVAHVTAGYLEGGVTNWAQQIEKVANATGMTPLLLPICHFLHDDIALEIAGEYLTERGCDWAFLPEKINVKDTAALIAASGGYIGTSLHGAVTAVSFAKPLAVLTREEGSKHEGTLKRAGVDNVVTLEVNDIADIFLTSLDAPLTQWCENSKQLAEENFKDVVGLIRQEKQACNRAPRREDMELLAKADREQITNIKVVLHRFLLRLLQLNRPVYTAYKRYRLKSKLRSQI